MTRITEKQKIECARKISEAQKRILRNVRAAAILEMEKQQKAKSEGRADGR